MHIADQNISDIPQKSTMSTTAETNQAQEGAPATAPSCIDRVAKLPMVEIALMKSLGIYERVKGSYEFVNWTLSTAEAGAKKGMDLAAPMMEKLHQPISAVDNQLCKGLDYVEAKFPCVKEQPQQIVEDVKMYSLDKVTLAKAKAQLLADLSWQKANEILATRYGDLAFKSVNSSANVAEEYFDYYFPPTPEEAKEQAAASTAVIPASDAVVDDRVMQTVHTVGRVSAKMGRRIYNTVSSQVQGLTKENAHEYVRSLVALLTLKNYIGTLDKTKEGEKKPEEKSPAS